MVYIIVNLLALLISNLLIAESSFLGLAISIYTYSILALIILDIKFMLITTSIGSVLIILDIFIEYYFLSDGSFGSMPIFDMNVIRLCLYGHFLLYILITVFLYFYLDKIRVRKIEKLLNNRTKLLEYLKNLNVKLSSYAFYHSHELRAPVSRALGLNELLLNAYNINDTEIKSIIQLLNQSVFEIDSIIRKMNDELEDMINDKQ